MSRSPRYIFHITHINNLHSIITAGGLLCDARKHTLSSAPTGIAFDNIKEKRARAVVMCGPRGYVADNVPFYFAPRSPMLYTISRGNVVDRDESDIVYLVSAIEWIHERSLQYVFCDGHPIVAFTSFFDNLSELDKIDWNLMSSKYWFDTRDDLDRKRRRQAEFLVHDFLPWNLIGEIAVRNQDMMRRVNSCIGSLAEQPRVTIKREWYYG